MSDEDRSEYKQSIQLILGSNNFHTDILRKYVLTSYYQYLPKKDSILITVFFIDHYLYLLLCTTIIY